LQAQEETMLTFGTIPPYRGKEQLAVGLSDDKRAITLTFGDFKTTLGSGKSAAAVVTHLFSLALPLQGDEAMAEVAFAVSGFALTTAGTTATLVLSVNGQTVAADFLAGADQSLLLELAFKAPKPSDCRLCVMLLLGRDAAMTDAEAFLNVTAIDVELLPRPR